MTAFSDRDFVNLVTIGYFDDVFGCVSVGLCSFDVTILFVGSRTDSGRPRRVFAGITLFKQLSA